MSVALDVAIGIVFLYLLLALIVTTVQELIATWFRLRAQDLYAAIAGMLAGNRQKDAPVADEYLKKFVEHPLIKNLSQPRRDGSGFHFPSYIPSRVFALCVLDILRGEKASAVTGARELLIAIRSTVAKIENHDELRTNLLAVLNDAELWEEKSDFKVREIAQRIEAWFNDRMARASGWYKRRAQLITFIMGCLLAGATNADSIHVGVTLWNNASLREAVVADAVLFVASHPPASPAGGVQPAPPPASSADTGPSSATPPAPAPMSSEIAVQLKNQIARLRDAGFPIGWTGVCVQDLKSWGWWLRKVPGWLITAFAISLGAKFWFDGLSRLLQIRGTGPKVSAKTGTTEGNGP